MPENSSFPQEVDQVGRNDIRRVILTDIAYQWTGIVIKVLYLLLCICGVAFFFSAKYLSRNFTLDELPVAKLMFYFPRSEFDYLTYLRQQGPAAALECLLFEGMTMVMMAILSLFLAISIVGIVLKLGCQNSFQPYRNYRSTPELLFKLLLGGLLFGSFFATRYNIYAWFPANAVMYPFYFGNASFCIVLPFGVLMILMRHLCYVTHDHME
jgi:hypothetical protein